MKRIAFLVNNVYVEGVKITVLGSCNLEDYIGYDLLVYSQNRLIILNLNKYFHEDTKSWAYATPYIKVLENYCIMEDCENYLSSHPDVEEDYVDNW